MKPRTPTNFTLRCWLRYQFIAASAELSRPPWMFSLFKLRNVPRTAISESGYSSSPNGSLIELVFRHP